VEDRGCDLLIYLGIQKPLSMEGIQCVAGVYEVLVPWVWLHPHPHLFLLGVLQLTYLTDGMGW